MNVTRSILVAALTTFLAVGCAQKSATTYASYGEPMSKLESKAVPVSVIVANPEAFANEPVLIYGRVTEVCAEKGCWAKISGDGAKEPVFVKFTCPIEGRLIPADAVGRMAFVEGTIEVKTLSEDEARHYAEDSGKSAAEIAKIVGPQKQIRVKSPSAKIAVGG
jgi:hypothetical protein